MLSIKAIGSSNQEVRYYADLGSAENHDYYSEDGCRQGKWWGIAATTLGLSGSVRPEVFSNVLNGISPDGKSHLVQLRKRGQQKRRAGFDLTFSVPKSFSLVRVQASDKLRIKMDECARESLLKTLQIVQNLCGVSRRGKNGQSIENAKLVAAIFEHETARGIEGDLPDANFHFHVVIPNIVVRADGSTGALDARPLFHRRMKMALGALFRAELSKQVANLGFETERPMKAHRGQLASWFELVCVPKELIQAMSKRRSQIQEWMSRHGLKGAKTAEKAALRTRSRKQKFSRSELTIAWKETCTKFGLTEKLIEQTATLVEGADSRNKSLDVVAEAIQTLVESKSRFSEIELLECIAVESQCRSLGIDEIRSSFEYALSNQDLYELVELKNSAKGLRTFTTTAMLQMESEMLFMANEFLARADLQIGFASVHEVLTEYTTLRTEQRQAIERMCSGSDIACVQGIAGSGKTYMLGVANEVWSNAGFKVLGTSLSAKATRGLEDGSGIVSVHIHKLLHELERGTLTLDDRTVIVVDEAGMVGTRQMHKLIERANRAGSKIVLVGDWKQLQAIDAGAAFRGIAESVGYVVLEEVIRQQQDWAREIVKDFRDGKSLRALHSLQENQQLFVADERIEAMCRLVDDWFEVFDPKSSNRSLAFAGTNLDVRELNRMMQIRRRSHGQLRENSLRIDGLTLHERDHVMITKNCAGLSLRNGMTGVISQVKGDELLLNLEDGRSVIVNTQEFDQLTLGYAMSVHKAQGITCDRAFVLTGDCMTDRELSYVEASRARGTTIFYADIESVGESVEDLAALMNRSRQKELALEYLREAS